MSSTRTPCPYCKKKRVLKGFILEKNCFFKFKDSQREKNFNVPKDSYNEAIHSFELEDSGQNML